MNQARLTSALLLGALLSAGAALAEGVLEAPFAIDPPVVQPAERPAPRLLFEALAMEPAAALPAARQSAAAEIEAIAAWNAAGNEPQKVGMVRPLVQPVEVELGGAGTENFSGERSRGLLQKSTDGLTWVARVAAAESSRLRLRLAGVELPAGAELLVYNAAGESVSFSRELQGPDGELWTPSVAGPEIFLEVRSADAAARHHFAIDAVAESFELDPAGRPLLGSAGGNAVTGGPDTSCNIASACVTTGTLANIASFRGAVARLTFVKDGGQYLCSGSLLNDSDNSGFIPYLLTANHCFSTQASASSLEAYWDYHPSSCGGLLPALGSLPRSTGGTLLASSGTSDFTFLRLGSAPAGANGRIYLGWNAASGQPANNTSVYGVHHPNGGEQSYTRSVIDRTPAQTCGGAPTSAFLYANPIDGATFGGSSGSPIANANLQVVGQLFGGCGPNSAEPCDAGPSDYDVFGHFATTHNAIAAWLDATGPLPCADSPTTLCLLNNRFKVQATYRTAGGQTGAGQAVRLTQETGYFWFFNQTNIEAVFKLLNACTPALGNHFWVFAGGLTDVEVTTTVTDTTSGQVKTYFNPLGTAFQPITDLGAFATCP